MPKQSVRPAGLTPIPALRVAATLAVTAALFFGCAALGMTQREVPPEFNQKVILEVSDMYVQHQAPRSGYDISDLQSFHTQHTLPVVVEEAFKEMFADVEVREAEEGIEMGAPEVPAIFEVKLADLAHDYYMEADNYRAEATLAVAMKSPDGHIFWQKAFRGEGYVQVDPQFSTGMGPQDAVVDAVRDALSQMQDAIIESPQVRLQMKHYLASDAARRQTDTSSGQ